MKFATVEDSTEFSDTNISLHFNNDILHIGLLSFGTIFLFQTNKTGHMHYCNGINMRVSITCRRRVV
jgi:hypothetical protein